MAGMSEAAVNEARERMAKIHEVGLTTEDVVANGVLISVYTPEGSRVISRKDGEKSFTITTTSLLNGSETVAATEKITAAHLEGGVVEGAESSPEVVFALIARGVTFPLTYAVEG